MQQQKMYTQEQLDIEIIKHEQKKIFEVLEKIDEKIKWVIGTMVSGFAGLFALMAHGFHWL